MDLITIILILLLAVIVSGIVSRAVPLPLPRPLFQIALGALIGLAADWRVTLDPDIFFLLFLAPLLFFGRVADPARRIVQGRQDRP